MSTIDRINADFLAARKARDQTRLALLSVLVGQITTKEKTFNPARPMLESEVIAEVKKMLDSVQETARLIETAPGRDEQRQRSAVELEMLRGYMPQQMTEEQIEAFALEKREQHMNLGQIMAALKAERPGEYDGRLASTIIKRLVS